MIPFTASIHFPLAREDLSAGPEAFPGRASIHFPLAREDGAYIDDASDSVHASIHFPLAREDMVLHGELKVVACFNPLPSCEGRQGQVNDYKESVVLQSTSLLRGKTGREGEGV